MSFVAVGRKYGVSDNAVRKWLRCYEAEGAATAAAPGGSGLAANPRLGGAGGEAGDLGARWASAVKHEAVVLTDPVGPDDLDYDAGVDGQPAVAEGRAEVDGPALV